MENYINKRTSPRFDCSVPIDGKKDTLFSKTKTVDVSATGLGVIADRPMPLNEKIAIELALRDGAEPVLVIGEVKWIRKISHTEQYRIGLNFSDIIDGSQEEIKSSLQHRFANHMMDF